MSKFEVVLTDGKYKILSNAKCTRYEIISEDEKSLTVKSSNLAYTIISKNVKKIKNEKEK